MRSACSPFSPFQSKFCSLASRGVGGAVRSPGLWSPVLEKSGEGSLPRTSFGDLSPTQKWMGLRTQGGGAKPPCAPSCPRDLV